MSYYFPFGSITIPTLVSQSNTATNVSLPISSTVLARSASYAVTVQVSPEAGTSGSSKSIESCSIPSLYISGSPGVTGPIGLDGSSWKAPCPEGTIECTDLNVSLSGAFPGYPNGINATLPTGSRYNKVCMEIAPGCNPGTSQCPDSLPTSSVPAIP